MMKKHLPFTLIELLVVIAIIAILAAMLLPALARARFVAKVANCAALDKSWGSAVYLHAADHNRKLIRANIPASTGRNSWDVGDLLFTSIEEYGIDWQMWRCPVAGTPYDTRAALWSSFHNNGGYVGWGVFATRTWWVPRTMSNGLTIPSDTTLYPTSLADDNASEKLVFSCLGSSKSGVPLSTSHMWAGEPHSVNQLFLDGHVITKAAREMTIGQTGNWYSWR